MYTKGRLSLLDGSPVFEASILSQLRTAAARRRATAEPRMIA
jgi:hypothetical protein